MRKIEQEMIAAIRAGVSRAVGANTRVDHPGNKPCYAEVRLHGHLIATNESGAWRFNLCGWNTPTTRSRLNALAREFGRSDVWTRQGVPFIGNILTPTNVPVNGWF
jgi:hypothetical protein